MNDSQVQTNPNSFVVVECKASIALPVDAVWKRISSFEGAGRFLDVACKLVAGNGSIGSVRQVGDAILEVMVGTTRTSYTYVQTKGPMAQYSYHGCVSTEAIDATSTSLIYTLVYDPTLMTAEQNEQQSVRLKGRFQGAADAMKRAAETQS